MSHSWQNNELTLAPLQVSRTLFGTATKINSDNLSMTERCTSELSQMDLNNSAPFTENFTPAREFMKMKRNLSNTSSRRSRTPLSEFSANANVETQSPRAFSKNAFEQDQWIQDKMVPISNLAQPDLGEDEFAEEQKSEMQCSSSDERSALSSKTSSVHTSPRVAGLPEPEVDPLENTTVHVNELPPEMVTEIINILTNEVPSSWGAPLPMGDNLRASDSLLRDRREIVKTIRFTGNVAWFQGTDGFVTMNIKGERVRDFFCHWSEIRACVQGRKSLGEGEAVEFCLMDDNKGGFKCKDVTGPNEAPVQGQDLRPKPSTRQNRPRLAKVGECYEYHEGKCNRAPGHCRYSHAVEPERLRISRAEAAQRNICTEIPALAYHAAPFVILPNSQDLLFYKPTVLSRDNTLGSRGYFSPAAATNLAPAKYSSYQCLHY